MSQTPSVLAFASLEEAARALPGIIRTLPQDCQPQVKVLTNAILATALCELLVSEPQVPKYDLSRFKELRSKRVSSLSPADAQYMLRATVSFLLMNLMVQYEEGDKGSAEGGYAQTLQSLMQMWELTPAMIADEAISTADAIEHF